MTLRIFKCPFCGTRFRADPKSQLQTGETEIIRKVEVSKLLSKGHRRTVDLTCPNPQCGQEFEVEVEG
jgi:hypothetical protein